MEATSMEVTSALFRTGVAPAPAGSAPEAELQDVDTPYGRVRINLAALLLGELLVTDEGAELEVVALDPLNLMPAPEEEEDWGE